MVQQMPGVLPTFSGQRGRNGQIKFRDKQGCTNRNRCTHTCNLACTDPLANPDCKQKVGHPDLLSSVFMRSQKYLCAISLQFASWVHLIWMQSNLGFDGHLGWQSPNRCTQTRRILYAQTNYRTLIAHQKPGHPDLLSWSKSPVNKTRRK